MRFRVVKVTKNSYRVERKKMIGWQLVYDYHSLEDAKRFIEDWEANYKARMNPDVVYEKVIREEWM